MSPAIAAQQIDSASVPQCSMQVCSNGVAFLLHLGRCQDYNSTEASHPLSCTKSDWQADLNTFSLFLASRLVYHSFSAFHLLYICLTGYADAGYLYPPSDYEQAIEQTLKLVSEPAFRQTMAAAARAEVERFGWNAAISRVRNLHYQRAIRIYKAHKR